MNPKDRSTIAISSDLRDKFRESLPRSAEMAGTIEALVIFYMSLPNPLKACFSFELDVDVTAVVVRYLLDKGELPAPSSQSLAAMGLGTSRTESRPQGVPPRSSPAHPRASGKPK